LLRPRKGLGLAVITALAVLAPSVSAASAAMTHSSASVDKLFGFNDTTLVDPAVRHLTATSDGTEGDSVDIACMQGATSDFTIASTTLGPSGALTYDIPESAIGDSLCRIAVVNSGDTTADAAAFSGPTIGGGYYGVYTTGGAVPYGFQIDHAYAKAYTDFYDLGDCGLCDMALLDPDGKQGQYLFYDNAYLSGTHAVPGGGTRPDLIIDGTRAYTPYEADSAKPGFPSLAVTHTQDPSTGDMTYVEEENLVACAPDEGTCTSYTTTPIHYKRTVRQDHGGRVVWITDVLTNTDAANSHDYDLDFEQYQRSSGHNGFRFPGESAYANHVAGDVVNSGFGDISTIRFVADTTNVVTGYGNPMGTLTVSPQPVRAWFGDSSGFNLQFASTIPAGGTKTITQIYSMGVAQDEVDGYAAQAEDSLAGPSVTITDPAADGSTVNTSTITVKGKASDNVGVSSLKVNGAEVSVAGDGTWSTPVALAEGANTITAVAKDAAGNQATATRTVTYTKPAPPPPPAVATITKNGKVKVTRKGKKILVDTGIKVGCPAGGPACTSAASAKTVKAVAAKLRKSKLTIAKKTFTIAAGTTKKIVLTLSAKGAKALKRNKKLRVKVTVVTKVGSGAAITTVRTITIKQPKAKH
jgi:hypothetical protein